MNLRRSPGNPSYAGYEYQISVTVWVALELMLAKGVTETLIIEPKSHEDIEVAITDPHKALLGLSAESVSYELVIQVKSRSTSPWTTSALADVLTGKQDEDRPSDSSARTRPLHMLATDPHLRYVFVTNESLQDALRPHSGVNLLDFPEVDKLPPKAKAGFDEKMQASIAPRLLLCPGITIEVLGTRIARLLESLGHVPSANHKACINELRGEVRRRIGGYSNGRWNKADLIAVFANHGGSVLPTRSMDHYVRPRSYDAIRRSLDDRHVVIISGPSGTGKTLTAEIIELDFRKADTPFVVVTAELGPGCVRSELMRSDPVLFHLRDPWGSNRLSQNAEMWSDELPKLLRNAGAGRKFLITSRSDVLESAGHKLISKLKPYLVSIEIEDYSDDDLANIYDGISCDLIGFALELAQRYKTKALSTLKRPYEIDRFLAALSEESPAKPRKIQELLNGAQINAISSVIADKISARGVDGVISASIIWAMLSARGAIAADIISRVVRHLRAVDPNLRSNVNALIGILVAGRDLRKDGVALFFGHPRVEDGLRIAMLHSKGEMEYVLSRLADALIAMDNVEGTDWGVETVLGILRATGKLPDVQLDFAEATHSRLDVYLESIAFKAKKKTHFESVFADLARYGSETHTPSRLARILMGRRPGSGRNSWKRLKPLKVSTEEIGVLSSDPKTKPLLASFICKVLPYTTTDYDQTIVPLLVQLNSDLVDSFWNALDTMLDLGGPSSNIDVIICGTLSGDAPDFDGVIERLAKDEAEVNTWMESEYKSEGRRAEEHEVDAAYADHIVEEPGERYFNSHEGMKTLVRLRRAREGVAWVPSHPHKQFIVYALSEIIRDDGRKPPAEELRILLGCSEGWVRNNIWSAAANHWDISLNDLLEIELSRTDLEGRELRQSLIRIAAVVDRSEDYLVTRLAKVAASTSIGRRLEMILDVMSTGLDSDPKGADIEAAQLERANRLAKTFPLYEDELGSIFASVLAGHELKNLEHTMSSPARSLLTKVLPQAPISITGPLAYLAVAVGIDPIATAERLLMTGEKNDGLAAVECLMIYDRPAMMVTLWSALNHQCYSVRVKALIVLVAKADIQDRARLIPVAHDRSADVRLEWSKLMHTCLWPEAVGTLVELLGDNRNFDNNPGYISGQTWSEFLVARAAAHALGAYDVLPQYAVEALLKAATNFTSPDPFVACAALQAIADKEDDRVMPILRAGLLSQGLSESPRHRPMAQAASWALFDRAFAGKVKFDDPSFARAAIHESAEVAGPLLMAFGIVGGAERERLITDLNALSLATRRELVMIAAAAVNKLPESSSHTYRILAALSVEETIDPVEKTEIEGWSLSLDVANDVQFLSVWLAEAAFYLPVREEVINPRKFRLPDRIRVMTTRSLSPAREQYLGSDDGM